MAHGTFCGRTRREFLWQAGGGFAGVALAALLGDDFFRAQAVAADGVTPFANPLAPKKPHSPARARSVIFLYMYGGPSHIDTFDHKPQMVGRDNQTVQVKTFGRGGKKNEGRIVEPRWKFKPYGQCGKPVSDLFPRLARHVDEIAFVHSMTADSPIHGSAMLQMNTGKILSGSPCLGSWVNYGLGSENEDLPGFVVMLDPRGGPISGARNWASGYMPAHFEGTLFRPQGNPILDLAGPEGSGGTAQRRLLDALRDYNDDHKALHGDNPALASRIASYELAYRMQASAPEATDLGREPEAIKELYGMNDKRSAVFGRQCLMARRLVERGVRFVQLFHRGWDQHLNLPIDLPNQARDVDQACYALITDLKQRGMLDDTLVVWGGEFGRTIYCQGKLTRDNYGRDHHPRCFTTWMAGGGVKPGVVHGETDDFSYNIVQDPVHIHDMNATILHCLGIDHKRLTYKFQGLDMRLTGVENHGPVKALLA